MSLSAPVLSALETASNLAETAGKTSDGREISEQDIAEMAEQYDQNTYAARINLEHLRFIFPYPEVSGYGDVVALKAEKQANGKTALEILGATDERKFHSCMTLFQAARPDLPVWNAALGKYFGGTLDAATLALL